MIQAFAIMTVIFVNQVPVSAKVMAFFYDRATCETAAELMTERMKDQGPEHTQARSLCVDLNEATEL